MREKNKNTAKLILIIALAVIAVFVIVIVVKLVGPATKAKPEDFAGQWADSTHANASLDLWMTDEENLIGMSSWQIDYDNAAFLDFEAVTVPGGLEITSCTRTDMNYDADGNVTETIVYENAKGTIKKGEGDTLVLHVEGDQDPEAFKFTLEGAY